MSDVNGGTPNKRLVVLAVVEAKDPEKPAYWPRIGAAFHNRDGSITILLDALPLGTNKLQLREQRDEARGGNGNGAARRAEARP